MFETLIGYHGDYLYTTGYIQNTHPDVYNRKKYLAQIHMKEKK